MTSTITPGTITMTGAQFHRLISAVLPSAAADDTLPALHAVHLETGPYGLCAAATDRYTLAVARYADPEPGRRTAAVTVPLPAVKAMLRLARRRDPAVSLWLGGGRVTMRTGEGISYRAPGVSPRDGRFPAWRDKFALVTAYPEVPPGTPVAVNAAFLARFGTVTDPGGLRISVRRSHSARCHTLLITAGDWFLAAAMTLMTSGQAQPVPAAWLADTTTAATLKAA